MLGRPVFAAGHGYGMGVAVVMEPDQADPLTCRGGVGTVTYHVHIAGRTRDANWRVADI